MGVHFLTFVILILIALLLGVNSNGQKKSIFLFIAFGLILFERSFVDPLSMPDLDSYQSTFYDISNIDIFQPGAIADYQYSHKEETGFLVFFKLASFFTSDFNVVLLIYGAIWLLVFTYIIAKYSSNIFLSFILLFLLIYGQSLFVLRQHMAIPLILLTYDSIINRKLIWFIILIFLASQFHTSAVIWFPMYFFYGSNKPYYLASLIVASAFGLSYLFSNFDWINSHMIMDYSSYINQDILNDNNNIPLAIAAFYGICYCVFLRKRVLSDGLNRLLLISIFIDIILFAVSNTLVLVTRLALYYHIAIIFIVPLITISLNSPIIRWIIIGFTITIFTYVQFWGSFFVNLQKMRLISPSVVHFIWFLSAYLIFYLFYVKILKSYLYDDKKKKNSLSFSIKLSCVK